MKEREDLIYGRHPVLEALQSSRPVDKVFLQQGTRGDFEKELRGLCKMMEVPFTIIPTNKLQRMVRGNHQGVVAQLAAAPYQKIEDLLPMIYERGETPLLLLLDGVTDVRNLGAIARSAEVCGGHALIIPQKNSAGLTADAVKSSAGALLRLPVCREKSLVNTVELLRMSGVQVIASDLQAETYLHELKLTEPLCIVMGAEGEGISEGVGRAADVRFRIPQAGDINSFNVSVAAGILLWEAMKARLG
ncbi:23S rRNA (guanosine(2251)-2'-O)-methyltransferase RlmB [Neolewinella lacunae]|uniref:23S rRNA (Guanosine(2251)-2'-O)-methyltransferase RlmB n=1 Tax=Neolewinella lacunae TaxID=1517758 RepID=A0A923PQP9_9BACT|nr:23S rRNA (guanosine(2251)-2'-O)-methyltransferase RlmB [Neolewinella lacunae]MBC6995734.1 23S rRNA (guanosine(2251)-2'-O)-methyltransferase RlmB [Neolewinella lacunae]MDN3636573.1 23S rRNA (guanosine(2251)-2'-O)-methyltransferase RlmB [Neolewinella lacunae]